MLKTVGSRSILYVMAADAEYGPHLQARFTPLVCGVGPVESAVNLTRALASERPHIVISLGSAGSRTLEQAEVYEVASVSYRDMDASALGFPRGVTPLSNLPPELPLLQVPGLPAARLATGASVVSGAGYEAIDADMVDMESFAVCRACLAFGVPMIGLRGISDGAQPLSGYMDWTRYLRVIDDRLAAAIDRLSEAFDTLPA